MDRQEQWSEEAITRLLFNWAPSTLFSYHIQVNHFVQFCCQRGYKPEAVPSAVLAEFFCSKASGSIRPRSILNTCSAVINCVFQTMDLESPTSRDMKNVINGLVK